MKRKYLVAVAGIVGLATLPLAASAAPNRGMGQGYGNRGSQTSQQSRVVTGTLNEEEKATIQTMLEEEKLAGDLYDAFYEKYGNEVFSRIANSEARHESAVTRLATSYGVDDPRKDAVGEFTNDELQALYDKLYAEGMKSEAQALEVARQFEIDDIEGLKDAQAMTTNSRFDKVFGNLERASEKHLREFTDAKAALS